jgi:hypothetical protein
LNGAQNLTVTNGGPVWFYGIVGGTTPLTSLTMYGNGLSGTASLNTTAVTTTGLQNYIENIVLGADVTLTTATLSVATVIGSSHALTLDNSGPGTLDGTMIGLTQLTIQGGEVLETNGTISAGSIIVTNSGSLGGNGIIYAPMTVASGATLSPGSPISLLTIDNSLTLSGTVSLELDASNSTNDVVAGLSNIVYGGTLSVTNLAGTLAVGDSFQLFGSASYGGAFTALQLPTLSNGLVWDTSNLPTNGTITVDAAPTPNFTSIQIAGPSTIQLHAMGTANQLYYLWASTNVAMSGSNWWLLGSNNATSGGVISFMDLMATNRQRFYRLTQ